MAHPRFSSAKDRSIVTIGVTAALLSVPIAAPLVTAAADSPFQPLRLEKTPLLDARPVTRPVTRPVAVVDETTGQLVDPKTGNVIDRAKAVIDPATGKLIDPVTGAIIPSDVLAPVTRPPVSPAAKSQAATPQKPSSPAGAVATGPLAVPPAPAGDASELLPPADQMVVGVVDEVLGATSDGSFQPLTSLLGDRKSSSDADSQDGASTGSSADGSASTRSQAAARAVPAPSDEARTIALASGSDAVEVQPSALGAPAGGASGVPYLLGALALSGFGSSHSHVQQQELDLQAPQVSIPADSDSDSGNASPAVANHLTVSERHLAAGQVTATSLPGGLDEAPSWLASTASGFLLLVGGTSVVYGTRRLRRSTA